MLTTLLVLLAIQFGLFVACTFVTYRNLKTDESRREASESLSNVSGFCRKLRLMSDEYARETTKFVD